MAITATPARLRMTRVGLMIVSPGDVIDGVYRFESIAATEARFTYLPLNQRQVMSVQGEGN
ncbi:secretion system X translation initiation factor [Ralstonia solanacearum]|nr:secretion system X translation initiation factor [Ralstonia solanacearum]